MKKTIIILSVVALLAGCEFYSNYNTYYADVEVKNFSSQAISISLSTEQPQR